MPVRLLLCALLLGATGVASAQNPPATAQQKPATRQVTPQQRAAIQKRNQQLTEYANQIIGMIDNNQVGQVWDGMSQTGQKAMSRSNFVKAVETERAKLGKVQSRKAAKVYARTSNGSGKLPAGTYVSVRYQTQFAESTKPMSELVSFHLDSDKKWRLSGYTIQELKALRNK